MKMRKTAKGASKEVYVKAIMMGAALLLLLAALIFFTTAWYTKMVSTSGVNLQAARWDYTANHTVDAVTANVYEYASLNQNVAAPGTGGWIPVKLGAQQSDTDVEYYLTVDRSSMSKEFRDRIYFYYLKDQETKLFDRLLTEEEEKQYEKIYFGASPLEPDNPDPVQMTGTIPKGGEITVYVYWEWIYEAPDMATDEEALEWDMFDTQVGMNPALYVEDMNATIKVIGVEVPKVNAGTDAGEGSDTPAEE